MRILVLGLVALALAGCVTVGNSLTADQVASFRLASVDVIIPEATPIRWADGEVAYAATKGVQALQAGTVAGTAESVAYLRAGVTSRVRAAFQRELGGHLTGARPVKVQVTVREVDLPTALQRVLIGGDNTIRGDVTIIDAKTGAVLSSYPNQTAVATAGQGIAGAIVDAAFLDAPIDRAVGRYASQYRGWLLKS